MIVVGLSGWSCGSTEPEAAPEVAAIVVSPASSTMALNARLPLQAEVHDGSGATVPDATITWTVQDPSIVSVSATGLVTALGVGTSQVAANALGKSGLAKITVTRVPVANVVGLPALLDLKVGATYQLSASAQDASGNALTDRTITWTTTHAAIARVNGSGLVTGVAVGTAAVTAASEGKSSTVTVTVRRGR